MNYALYKHLLRDNTSTQDMIQGLKELATTEIADLIQPLSSKKKEQLILAFAAQLYMATDECYRCHAKNPQKECCDQCEGDGRIPKDHTIKRLMSQVEVLEQRLKKSDLREAAVGPI